MKDDKQLKRIQMNFFPVPIECPFRCQNNEEEKPLVYSAQILLYSNLHGNSDLQENIQEILTGMKSDGVLKAIQSDNSLMSFGSAMLKRVGRG